MPHAGGITICAVYPTRDGYIAIVGNHDRHFAAILRLMLADAAVLAKLSTPGLAFAMSSRSWNR